MSLTVDQAILKAYIKATRKDASSISDIATAKYNAMLAHADTLQKEWENEDGVEWLSLYSMVYFDDVVIPSDQFALPDEVRTLSRQEGDVVTIISTDDVYYYYDIVNPQTARARYFRDPTGAKGIEKACYLSGRNLMFTNAFDVEDPQIDGEIYAPCFLYTSDIDAGSDVIQVDDPLWMVDKLAAFYVQNDKVRQNLYPDFVAQANAKMVAMKRANGSQIEEVPILVDDSWMGL